jgi:Asp-tRNA(Asn)/Glu-tRNA(Gln) amidotransferase C subunit
MALTTEEVRKIASLARLRFAPDEEAAIAGQLGKIVDFIDQLQRFEAGPAATTASAAAAAAPAPPNPPAPLGALPPQPPVPPAPPIPPRAAPEADDLALPCLPRETFLANAPASLDGFLLVPEVKTGHVPGAMPGVDDEPPS